MAKVKNPETLSGYFKISPSKLSKLRVLDCTLAIDTKLFIDPLLFHKSKHPEIRKSAVLQYRRHFEKVIKFLVAMKSPDDIAGRTAKRLLSFPEIKGTCLGYGAGSINGRGSGPYLTNRIFSVAKEIVDLGINDPDLFSAMALFEANIGPDRISDMATNVAYEALIAFNKRILSALGLKGKKFEIVKGKYGKFLQNPFQDGHVPIILVPSDVLRELPIAYDWDGVARAARENQAIRDQVNAYISQIWAVKARRDKELLKEEVLKSQEAFATLLATIHKVRPLAYDINHDPEGLVRWARIAKEYTDTYPFTVGWSSQRRNLNSLMELVQRIVQQFQHLVEQCGLNKELFKDSGKPRHESTAQRLFFAVAYSYCEANNIDISPEIDTGNGRVDFKLSAGFKFRVLVEIKLSTNSSLLQGYTTQLELYKKSQRTLRAFYVVIDVGSMGKKDKKLIKLRNDIEASGKPCSDISFIDGILKASASKRKG